MAVNCATSSKTEEKKYHHNVGITAVFDGVYGHLYFVAKTTQAELSKGHRHVNVWNRKKVANLVVRALCHTK